MIETTCQLPDSPVQVSSASGSIRIQAPALFASPDDATIHTLMERLFHVAAVEAFAVDREHAAIDIQYDRFAFDSQTALRTLSARLAASDGPLEESLMHQYLIRVPGRVKRVERRLSDGAIHHADAQIYPAESLLVVENLIVEYDPMTVAVGLAISGSARAFPNVAGALPADVTRPWIGEVLVGGVRRIVNLTAAGGCLVMSIVGVVTPGIPTVPFVLATGYFLARSSPKLHEKFRRAPLFGRMISDYEDLGGLRRATKVKAIAIALGLMAITVVLAGGELPILLVVGLMGSLGIYMVARIPTVRDASVAALAPG